MEAPLDFTQTAASLAGSISKGIPMISVPDIAATLDWYTSIGFKEIARYEEGGVVNFVGMLALGKAEFMLRPETHPGPRDTSLWFYTDAVDALYRYFRSFRPRALAKQSRLSKISTTPSTALVNSASVT
jgi:hypothetical protein